MVYSPVFPWPFWLWSSTLPSPSCTHWGILASLYCFLWSTWSRCLPRRWCSAGPPCSPSKVIGKNLKEIITNENYQEFYSLFKTCKLLSPNTGNCCLKVPSLPLQGWRGLARLSCKRSVCIDLGEKIKTIVCRFLKAAEDSLPALARRYQQVLQQLSFTNQRQ